MQPDKHTDDLENKDIIYALVDNSPRSVLLRKPNQSIIHR